MSDALEPVREPELAALTPAAMPELFKLAVEKGGVDALERLAALHERMMDRESAREFAAAMAAFQEECPPIRKTSTAKVVTKAGGAYSYNYAELDEIARTVRPFLHKHGLSYSWDCTLSDDSAKINVDCTVAHANGYSRKSQFQSSTTPQTSSMSKQQEVAAALTFGKRQSLISALGLTTCDPDADGASEPEAKITPDQVIVLEALIDKRSNASPGARARVLEYALHEWGAETLEQIPASRFDWLVGDIKKKIEAQK